MIIIEYFNIFNNIFKKICSPLDRYVLELRTICRLLVFEYVQDTKKILKNKYNFWF